MINLAIAMMITPAHAGGIAYGICTTASRDVDLGPLTQLNGTAGTITSIGHNSTEVRDGVTYYLTDHGEYTRSGNTLSYTATEWINDAADEIWISWTHGGQAQLSHATFNVDKCNTAPVFADEHLIVCIGESLELELADLVLDLEGDDIEATYLSSTVDEGGVLTVSEDNSHITYTANEPQHVRDSFLTYEARDVPANNRAEHEVVDSSGDPIIAFDAFVIFARVDCSP